MSDYYFQNAEGDAPHDTLNQENENLGVTEPAPVEYTENNNINSIFSNSNADKDQNSNNNAPQSREAHLRQRRQLSSVHYHIRAVITTTLPLTHGTSPFVLYNTTTALLTSAMGSSSYTTTLRSKESSINTRRTFHNTHQSNMNATISAVVIHYPPTAMPTFSPSSIRPIGLPRDSLIITVVVVVAGSILIAIGVYYLILHMRSRPELFNPTSVTGKQVLEQLARQAELDAQEKQQQLQQQQQIDNGNPAGFEVSSHMTAQMQLALAQRQRSQGNGVGLSKQNSTKLQKQKSQATSSGQQDKGLLGVSGSEQGHGQLAPAEVLLPWELEEHAPKALEAKKKKDLRSVKVPLATAQSKREVIEVVFES